LYSEQSPLAVEGHSPEDEIRQCSSVSELWHALLNALLALSTHFKFFASHAQPGSCAQALHFVKDEQLTFGQYFESSRVFAHSELLQDTAF